MNFRNPYSTLPDISTSPERVNAFDASSRSAASENSTFMPSNNLSDYPAGDFCHNEETDSDETRQESSKIRPRYTRPSRKSKRRTVASTDRDQAATCTDTIVAPSSSGYQSQNHSSR